MREKYAVARQAQRELAAYIKDNPQLTWQDIAKDKNVSFSQVSKVARLFNLSRSQSNKPLQRLKPLTDVDIADLKKSLGTGEYCFRVSYIGNVVTLKNKATNVIPEEFLLPSLDGEEWPL